MSPAAAKAQFAENGFVVLEHVFEAQELTPLRRRAVELAQAGAPLRKAHQQLEPAVAAGESTASTFAASLRKIRHLAAEDDLFLAHASDRRILDVVEQLLGPDLVLASDQIFMKPPRVGSRQNYHQDSLAGFYLDPPDLLVSCWCAIDPSTLENGCLWMIPRSHQRGPLSRSQCAEYRQRADGSEPADAVPVELAPGSCVFHHGLTLHGSRANDSELPRWGYATHYASAHCRPTADRPPGFTDQHRTMRGRRFPGCV